MTSSKKSLPLAVGLFVAGSGSLSATATSLGTLTPAVDVTLDGTAGLDGSGQGRESLHGTVIASLAWSQTPDGSGPAT